MFGFVILGVRIGIETIYSGLSKRNLKDHYIKLFDDYQSFVINKIGRYIILSWLSTWRLYTSSRQWKYNFSNSLCSESSPMSEWVSSFVTTHQHIIGYSVLESWRQNHVRVRSKLRIKWSYTEQYGFVCVPQRSRSLRCPARRWNTVSCSWCQESCCSAWPTRRTYARRWL